MKKRNIARIISFLTAVILVLTVTLFKYVKKADYYKVQTQNIYSGALNELNSSLDNISATLYKARFITSAESLSGIASTLLTEAELSKSALANLPQSYRLETLNRFLSQVGNYALAVSKKLANGGAPESEDVKNLESLSRTAIKISNLIKNTQITHDNADYWASELDEKVKETAEISSLADSLGEIEEEISDMPSLIYDGPYSDHILEKAPEMMKGTMEVDEKEAHSVAAKTALCNLSDLKFDGVVDGKIPSYRFTGENVTVTVSKMGGYAVFMRKENETGGTNLSYTQARSKARRYLEMQGLTSLKETYFFTNEGVCVVNFAFLDGETICYTDLIKVGVAMDSGEVVLYEAAGYLSNHKDRAFNTPIHTKEEAEKVISRNLTVKSTALALIPTNALNEVRCYEFSCISPDDREVLVYINALSLKEEEILILLKTDGGTLVK